MGRFTVVVALRLLLPMTTVPEFLSPPPMVRALPPSPPDWSTHMVPLFFMLGIVVTEAPPAP